MTAPHISARKTALLALSILLVMLAAAVLFESGQAPLAYAVKAFGPSTALAAVPLVYIALALGRGPSRSALALGVAYPVAILVSFAQAASRRYESGTEGAMDVVYSFVFFWFSKPWMLFLFAFVPVLLRLTVVSWRAYRAKHGRRVAPIIAWGVAMVLAIS